ncbi:trigger factor [Alkalilimnicola ehrlichii]|uniref:Trigger factor n=1 Tax=Alkalilimnicola ehrlichii TaxID=351052 RepID=A0A3E0X083_9GAMM|nr:trigger factor [Alkalilimnicola ehrlichii]RFA30477.1 trigger factor [Alkalilimnicola ehrlichii]RFA38029.1 trigger factor [Alkalilimnicola ehrlichii]
MQVSVETTQGLQRRMTVQVPSERVDKEVESRLRSLSGRVRLDGFRPGKVPLKVVKKRYGEQVRGEVLGELIQSTYGEAVTQQSLRPAGAPEIDPKQIDAGQDIEYVATFEVMPEVEVKGLETIEVERPQVEVGEEDVDRIVENLRKQRANFVEVERAAQAEDRVVIDFKGEIDGKEFAGNEGSDVPVQIGSGQMPKEFEEGLEGLKAGDKKDIDYSFPENFPDKDIAEKTATFHVEVKKVEEPQLPAVDDAFAEQFGITDGGVEKLRENIRESLERERDQAVQAKVKPQVLDGLAEANEVELPQVLVDGEISHLREQAKERAKQFGQEQEDDDLPASMFEEEAKRRVKLGLLVNEIVRANEIKLDQDRVRKVLEGMAAQYEQPQEVIRYYMQNRKMMESIEIAVMEDQVVDWLLERAKVTDKPTGFQELMGVADNAEAEDND